MADPAGSFIKGYALGEQRRRARLAQEAEEAAREDRRFQLGMALNEIEGTAEEKARMRALSGRIDRTLQDIGGKKPSAQQHAKLVQLGGMAYATSGNKAYLDMIAENDPGNWYDPERFANEAAAMGVPLEPQERAAITRQGEIPASQAEEMLAQRGRMAAATASARQAQEKIPPKTASWLLEGMMIQDPEAGKEWLTRMPEEGIPGNVMDDIVNRMGSLMRQQGINQAAMQRLMKNLDLKTKYFEQIDLPKFRADMETRGLSDELVVAQTEWMRKRIEYMNEQMKGLELDREMTDLEKQNLLHTWLSGMIGGVDDTVAQALAGQVMPFVTDVLDRSEGRIGAFEVLSAAIAANPGIQEYMDDQFRDYLRAKDRRMEAADKEFSQIFKAVRRTQLDAGWGLTDATRGVFILQLSEALGKSREEVEGVINQNEKLFDALLREPDSEAMKELYYKATMSEEPEKTTPGATGLGEQ